MKPEELHSYRFKSFTLKPVERQLLDHDRPVSLTPKAFDVLTHLIVNAGHLVTKEELMEKIWSESFVEEANLARLVHTIRKTLGEDENGNKFIETVPTKGYRFVAELEKIVVASRENKETFATNGSEDYWPDRLESATPIDMHVVSRPMPGKISSRWLLAGFGILVVVGLVAAFAVWRNNKAGTTASKDKLISIAVLPFRPIGPGEHDHSFNVAFANSVMADLNQSNDLTVRPFEARDYTELTAEPVEVGKERGADYVLDSNYILNGGRLQVTSYLIKRQDQIRRKTLEYKGGDTDLYAAGPNVAGKIVPDLLAKLNVAATVRGNRGTENEDAWRSYLQGMILSQQEDRRGWRKGARRI
jgi:DNA-binding winged helix-turn-helix (wHTH) protein/TolB-like protein